MRKTIVAFALGVVVSISATTALAHHGTPHRSVYRQVSGPTWMPSRVIIRCAGWAEDTASVLKVVRFGGGLPPVYRCLTGAEV